MPMSKSSPTSPNTAPMSDQKAGVLLAIAAYFMWGLAPIYFKQLQGIPAVEILMHRIVWSAVVLVGLIFALKHITKVKVALQSPKVMLMLLASGILLGGNWLLFIWAINNDHLLEASLGYYINPLFNVLFGFLFLGERFRRLQKLAVGLAFSGVLILLITFGEVPIIALTLALSFSLYGLLRKQVSVDSIPGLLIETIMMLPLALGYWLWTDSETSNFANNTVTLNALLVFAGIITTAPLLCFTAAARRILYSTLGFFQYIGPTLMFILAVLLYKEPFTLERLLTFGFVWAGLAIFTFDAYQHHKKNKI